MANLKCKECRYCGVDRFENTTMHGCNVLMYLIRRNHNRFLTDALVGEDDNCIIYKYLLEYFIKHESL